jgi:hypothetical protein
MILLEFFNKVPDAYQDLSDDNSQLKLNNLRKTKLTLKQINKLRRMNDVRTFEYKEQLKKIKKQYFTPPQAPL